MSTIPAISVDILAPALRFPSNFTQTDIVNGTCQSLGLPEDQLEFINLDDGHLCCLIKNSSFSLNFIETLYQENQILQFRCDKSTEALNALQETLQDKQNIINHQHQTLTLLTHKERQLNEEVNQWKAKYEEELYKRIKNEKMIEKLKSKDNFNNNNNNFNNNNNNNVESRSRSSSFDHIYSGSSNNSNNIHSSYHYSNMMMNNNNNNNNNNSSTTNGTSLVTPKLNLNGVKSFNSNNSNNNNNNNTNSLSPNSSSSSASSASSASFPSYSPRSSSNYSPNPAISPYLEREIEMNKSREREFQKERESIQKKPISSLPSSSSTSSLSSMASNNSKGPIISNSINNNNKTPTKFTNPYQFGSPSFSPSSSSSSSSSSNMYRPQQQQQQQQPSQTQQQSLQTSQQQQSPARFGTGMLKKTGSANTSSTSLTSYQQQQHNHNEQNDPSNLLNCRQCKCNLFKESQLNWVCECGHLQIKHQHIDKSPKKD